MSNSSIDNWESHWQNYAESAEKNPAQKLRRNLILSHLSSDDKKILDIGSGQGDLLLDIHTQFQKSHLYGIELSQSGITVAKKKLPHATFIQHNFLLPLNCILPKFNKAICSEVLEHLEDPLLFLKNIFPLIEKDGSLLVSVPAGPRSAFDIHIGHRKHYTKKELIALLNQADFHVKMCLAVGFPFFNLYKLIVILRGKKLISDVTQTSQQKTSGLAKIVMSFFDILFKFNISSIPLGWQLFAIASPKKTTQREST